MNFMKKNWQKLVLTFYALITPFSLLYADGGNSGCDQSQGKICNPLGTTSTVPDLIKTILKGALTIGIPVVALAIIYCGFLFVVARGKPEELKKAKDALLWTVIGAAVLLGAYAIAQMISSTVLAL
jgi:hypothetical protein